MLTAKPYLLKPLITVLNDGEWHSLAQLQKKLDLNAEAMKHQLILLERHFPHRLGKEGRKIRLYPPLAIFAAADLAATAGGTEEIEVIDTCLSTNDLLLARIKKKLPIHRRILVTNEQLRGRGRGERRWQSFVGDSIIFSIGWQLQDKKQEIATLPLVVAVAVARVLRRLKVPVALKWPNDLVVGKRKLGGVLVENVRQSNCQDLVIGVGINYFLPPPAGTVIQERSSLLELNPKLQPLILLTSLIRAILMSLEQFFTSGFADFQADFNRWHRDQGSQVVLSNDKRQEIKGVLKGIGADGSLELVDAAGISHFIISASYSLIPAAE